MKNLNIDSFNKKHDFIIAIDSDGTVIDAMNAKHKKCLGPQIIKVWQLEEYQEEILTLWDKINLYDTTRGINRFLGLLMILERINFSIKEITDIEILKSWVENTSALSNKDLKQEIEVNDSIILKKALKWSLDSNIEINALTEIDKPYYEGFIDCMNKWVDQVDIAVVSSSTQSSLLEEWGSYDFLKYIDILTSQEVGTKGECLRMLIDKGYNPNNILMIGDAYPDVEAAKDNGVNFYPILVNNEKESWDNLKEKFIEIFLNNNFEKHQNQVLAEFKDNFEKIGK